MEPYMMHKVFATKNSEDSPGDLSSLPTPLAPGDLILFGGHGFTSNVIKLFTDKKNHAVSHCGVMVSETTLVESTTLNGENGVNLVPICLWVDEYPGDIWVKYLKPEVLGKLDKKRLVDFLLDQSGRPYDKFQAVLSGFGIETPDAYGGAKKWYCSEIAACAYIEGGVLPPGMGTDITPAGLADLPIFTKAYQIKGRKRELK